LKIGHESFRLGILDGFEKFAKLRDDADDGCNHCHWFGHVLTLPFSGLRFAVPAAAGFGDVPSSNGVAAGVSPLVTSSRRRPTVIVARIEDGRNGDAPW
jgi:hypothetical protein